MIYYLSPAQVIQNTELQMNKLYVVTCREPNDNAGGKRIHVGIYYDRLSVINSIISHHHNNCVNSTMQSDLDEINEIMCDKCTFSKMGRRTYCNKCKKNERELFEKNNLPLENLYCGKCTYEQNNLPSGDEDNTRKRNFCKKCELFCSCECDFEPSTFNEALNKNENTDMYTKFKDIDERYVYIDLRIENIGTNCELKFNS